MKILVILLAYKQVKSKWILNKILKLKTYIQNALNTFINNMLCNIYIHMLLYMFSWIIDDLSPFQPNNAIYLVQLLTTGAFGGEWVIRFPNKKL
jgi:hypothetical protein